MGSLLHCLLRSCFEEENESQEGRTYEPPTASRMVRSAQYESTSQGEQEEKVMTMVEIAVDQILIERMRVD